MHLEKIKSPLEILKKSTPAFIDGCEKYNRMLYEQLEAAITDENMYIEVLADFKEHFRLKNTEIVNYTGLSKSVVTAMLDGEASNEQHRYAVVKYLRSISYYGRFSYIPYYIFVQLLELLHDIFSPQLDKQNLARLSGMTVNDISPILKGKKPLSAKEQYDMLVPFYWLCFDSFNNSIEEFAPVQMLLDELLKTNQDLSDNISFRQFADVYFKACIKADEVSMLSELTKIRTEDLQEIFKDEDFPYYFQKVHELQDIMKKRGEDLLDSEKLYWQDRMKIKYVIENRAYYKDQKDKRQGYIAPYKNEIGEWFLTLPDILKELVFKYARAQADVLEEPAFDFLFTERNHIRYQDRATRLDLIHGVIVLFRKISYNEQLQVLHKLAENPELSAFEFPEFLKDIDYETGADKCCKAHRECVALSFFFAMLAGTSTLADIYRNAPVNNSIDARLFMKERYGDVQYVICGINLYYAKEMLNFTAEEWRLAGYIETAVFNGVPLNTISDLINSYINKK